MLISALNTLQGADRNALVQLVSDTTISEKDKLEQVRALYNKAQVKETTLEQIKDYFSKASTIVDAISIPDSQKTELRLFMNELINRIY